MLAIFFPKAPAPGTTFLWQTQLYRGNKWFLILVLATESLERQAGMPKTRRANENTPNIFPVITSSQLLSQSYVFFSFGVEKAGSCFCNVHVISRVWGAWGLPAWFRHLRWVMGAAGGSCGKAAGSLRTCCGAARPRGRQAEPQGRPRKMWRGRGEDGSCPRTRQEAPFMPCTSASLPNCTSGPCSCVRRCHTGCICISPSFGLFGKSLGCSAEELKATQGGAGCWVDRVAFAPVGCDRRMAPHRSLLGNLHTCPERKRGGEQMQPVKKDFRDVSMAADANRSEERGALLG